MALTRPVTPVQKHASPQTHPAHMLPKLTFTASKLGWITPLLGEAFFTCSTQQWWWQGGDEEVRYAAGEARQAVSRSQSRRMGSSGGGPEGW